MSEISFEYIKYPRNNISYIYFHLENLKLNRYFRDLDMYILFKMFDERTDTASLSSVNPTLCHFHRVLKLSCSRFTFPIEQAIPCPHLNPTMLLACTSSSSACRFVGAQHTCAKAAIAMEGHVCGILSLSS